MHVVEDRGGKKREPKQIDITVRKHVITTMKWFKAV